MRVMGLRTGRKGRHRGYPNTDHPPIEHNNTPQKGTTMNEIESHCDSILKAVKNRSFSKAELQFMKLYFSEILTTIDNLLGMGDENEGQTSG